MEPKISGKFAEYQKKYPLYTREAIIEIMLTDGVITFDTAKKIKSGASLFLLDNRNFPESGNNLNMTEIFGAKFTERKQDIKTGFNRKIEYTFQSEKQGDCWLLSDINALNQTEWGKQAIYDSIIPDTDNSGGVTIKFKGSPLEQREFHITAEEIDNARNSGNYSFGDDDMIAFELATEKTFREMVKLGMAKPVYKDSDMEAEGLNYRSFIFGGVKTKEHLQFPISALLGLQTKEINTILINKCSNSDNINNRLFKYLEKNNNENLSLVCSFYPGIDLKDNKVHGGHAYTVKNIKFGEYITLIDPYKSDKEFKINWHTVTCIDNIKLTFKNNITLNQLNQLLTKEYREKEEEFMRVFGA